MPIFNEQLQDILKRVSTWPEEWQQRFLRLALELEAKMSNKPYAASSDELRSIDQGLSDDAASQEEVKTAYDKFQRP